MSEKKYKIMYRLLRIAGTDNSLSTFGCTMILESSDKEALEQVRKKMLSCFVPGSGNHTMLDRQLAIIAFREEVESLDSLARALKSIVGELDRVQAERAMVALGQELGKDVKSSPEKAEAKKA